MSLFAVVVIVIAREGGGAHHREGGGGGDISREDRGKRGVKRQDRRPRTMAAMPVFDDNGNDGIAVRRTGRSPSIRRRCARYLIMPSWWGRCGAQSSAAPSSSSVERCCRRGEGHGLVGGDCDRGPRSGAHPAGRGSAFMWILDAAAMTTMTAMMTTRTPTTTRRATFRRWPRRSGTA